MPRGWTFLAWAGTALVAVALASPVLSVGGPSANTLKPVNVHVDSVVASDTNEGVDNRLASMGPRLHSLFSYTSYRLITHQDGKAQPGKEASFQLPGGEILHIEPEGSEGNMIRMQLVLFQGDRPAMTTDLRLRDGGHLILGGRRYEQGMLIIVIGADCANQKHPTTAAEK